MVSLSSPSPPDAPATASRSPSRSHLMDAVFSYDGNVMLAAIVCLLLVILFVLLLHFYARCFLSSSSFPRRPRRRLRPPPSSAALAARLQTLARDAALLSPSRGLDPSTISSIPLFVAGPEGGEKDEECVVCLGGFEENDVGRRLPGCGHGFHVDCIDTWLRSRASCPICREPVVADARRETENKNKLAVAAEDADPAGAAQESRDATVQEETGSGSTEVAIDIAHDGGGDDGDDDDAGSPSSSSSTRTQQPATTLGDSLKRMLSRNRAENKIHPSSASSNGPESNASC
ncbi:RING-H2 finger protein ATL63 [Eucalyptus grandis]|uniref:RING-H2 finger protein ATL63 n=1 Tax=Eucalyptus grandis TaxID=71139 RepID=UPI00192E9ECE|nr:RING-H2 finger protein ATL63 [Eucalyptus grandis]